MKKTGRMLAVLLLSLLFALPLAACGKKDDAGLPKSAVVADFESYEEMQTFNWYNKFGKAETSNEHVTRGNKSMRLEIVGAPGANMPAMYIWCDTEYFNKSDFTYARALTADVYNDSAAAIKIKLSITTRKDRVRKEYPATEITLEKGKNNLMYSFDRQAAKYLCDMDAVEYIRFDFQQPDSYDKPANVIYMDNLEVHYDYTEVQPITKTFAEDEIYFFEDKADLFNIKAFSWQASSASFAKLSINTDEKYVSQGKKSLKIEVQVNPADIDRYPGIYVPGEYLKNFDLTKYKDDDTISFDLFNGGKKNKAIAVFIADKNDAVYKLNGNDGFIAKAGEWAKAEMRIGDIRAAIDQTKLENIQINYANETSGDQYNMYLDNFRFNVQ